MPTDVPLREVPRRVSFFNVVSRWMGFGSYYTPKELQTREAIVSAWTEQEFPDSYRPPGTFFNGKDQESLETINHGSSFFSLRQKPNEEFEPRQLMVEIEKSANPAGDAIRSVAKSFYEKLHTHMEHMPPEQLNDPWHYHLNRMKSTLIQASKEPRPDNVVAVLDKMLRLMPKLEKRMEFSDPYRAFSFELATDIKDKILPVVQTAIDRQSAQRNVESLSYKIGEYIELATNQVDKAFKVSEVSEHPRPISDTFSKDEIDKHPVHQLLDCVDDDEPSPPGSTLSTAVSKVAERKLFVEKGGEKVPNAALIELCEHPGVIPGLPEKYRQQYIRAVAHIKELQSCRDKLEALKADFENHGDITAAASMEGEGGIKPFLESVSAELQASKTTFDQLLTTNNEYHTTYLRELSSRGYWNVGEWWNWVRGNPNKEKIFVDNQVNQGNIGDYTRGIQGVDELKDDISTVLKKLGSIVERIEAQPRPQHIQSHQEEPDYQPVPSSSSRDRVIDDKEEASKDVKVPVRQGNTTTIELEVELKPAPLDEPPVETQVREEDAPVAKKPKADESVHGRKACKVPEKLTSSKPLPKPSPRVLNEASFDSQRQSSASPFSQQGDMCGLDDAPPETSSAKPPASSELPGRVDKLGSSVKPGTTVETEIDGGEKPGIELDKEPEVTAKSAARGLFTLPEARSPFTYEQEMRHQQIRNGFEQVGAQFQLAACLVEMGKEVHQWWLGLGKEKAPVVRTPLTGDERERLNVRVDELNRLQQASAVHISKELRRWYQSLLDDITEALTTIKRQGCTEQELQELSLDIKALTACLTKIEPTTLPVFTKDSAIALTDKTTLSEVELGELAAAFSEIATGTLSPSNQEKLNAIVQKGIEATALLDIAETYQSLLTLNNEVGEIYHQDDLDNLTDLIEEIAIELPLSPTPEAGYSEEQFRIDAWALSKRPNAFISQSGQVNVAQQSPTFFIPSLETGRTERLLQDALIPRAVPT